MQVKANPGGEWICERISIENNGATFEVVESPNGGITVRTIGAFIEEIAVFPNAKNDFGERQMTVKLSELIKWKEAFKPVAGAILRTVSVDGEPLTGAQRWAMHSAQIEMETLIDFIADKVQIEAEA